MSKKAAKSRSKGSNPILAGILILVIIGGLIWIWMNYNNSSALAQLEEKGFIWFEKRQELVISDGLDKLTDLSSIRSELSIIKPKILSLGGCKNLENIRDIAGISSLEEIFLTGCTSLTSIEGVENQKNLRVLELNGCAKVSDLSPLSGLNGLATINLLKCPEIKSLEPLRSHPNMERIHLGNLGHVSDFSPISAMTKLSVLFIENCPKLEDLNMISAKETLINIDVNRCEMLKNIEGIRGLKAISFVRIGDAGLITEEAKKEFADLYGPKIEFTAPRVAN